jgi:hypothetical protein
MAIATLYLVWEQQVRKFLFKEMSHTFTTSFPSFCTRFEDIENLFELHGVRLQALDSWRGIEELHLLCNVIKHGDGSSAKRLRRCNPSLFREGHPGEGGEILDSTLLDQSLDLKEAFLEQYALVLSSFWDELPERSYIQR